MDSGPFRSHPCTDKNGASDYAAEWSLSVIDAWGAAKREIGD